MKALAALLAGLLTAGLTACGGSSATSDGRASGSTGVTSSSHGVPPGHGKKDRDGDEDNNDDDLHTLNFGHAADASDSRALTHLVTNYFAAAAREDGARACSLLTPFVAESVVEEDGHSQGLKGNSCAAVMSKLFAHEHRHLLGESASLKVLRVRIDGGRSLVVLEFHTTPQLRRITARLSGNRWTLVDLLDELVE